MTLEQYKEAMTWLDANLDKWHMEKDEPVWDVPLKEIPELVQQYFIDRKEAIARSKERTRIRKGLKI